MDRLHKRLTRAGLLPTRQRKAIAGLLFTDGDRHLTADELYTEAREAGLRVSRATVYNTLHAFVNGGLLREVPIEPDRSYFDTNPEHACHVYFDDTCQLIDVRLDPGELRRLARRLGGIDPERLSVVIHVRGAPPPRLARRLRAAHRH